MRERGVDHAAPHLMQRRTDLDAKRERIAIVAREALGDGKGLHPEHVAFGHDARAVDGVAQLTHVAGPPVVGQTRSRGGSELLPHAASRTAAHRQGGPKTSRGAIETPVAAFQRSLTGTKATDHQMKAFAA